MCIIMVAHCFARILVPHKSLSTSHYFKSKMGNDVPVETAEEES